MAATGSKTDTLEQIVLDLLFGTIAAGWTRPADFDSWDVILFTTLPDDAASGGVEATGGNYAAVMVANTDAEWSRTNSVATNVNAISFPVLNGSIGTVLGWGLKDAGGVLRYWGAFDAADQKAYVANDQPIIPAGALTVTED